MGKFEAVFFEIDGPMLIKPTVFGDSRGYFLETFNEREMKEIGLNVSFVQDNESKSKKGVLRGLHFQTKNPQGKLVRVIQGEVFDVAVDLRKESKTYGKWLGVNLSAENKSMFYIPPGFAHGFLVTSEEAIFSYKCTTLYDAASDCGIIYNDPTIGINWPQMDGLEFLLSDKDTKLISFDEFKSPF